MKISDFCNRIDSHFADIQKMAREIECPNEMSSKGRSEFESFKDSIILECIMVNHNIVRIMDKFNGEKQS